MAEGAERGQPAVPGARVVHGNPSASRSRFLHRIVLRFVRISVGRKLLIAEAVAWLALSRVALLVVPFRYLAGWFGTVAASNARTALPRLSEVQETQIRDVSWAVTRSARYVPFRAVCLPQAIAAKAMLGRRGVPTVMHFGVMKQGNQPLMAHAWLDAGAIEVTGFPVGGGFVEVARFL